MHDPKDPLIERLQRAPTLAPPEALWTRLHDGQRRAIRRRRFAVGATASALSLLLVTAVPWLSLPPQAETHPVPQASAAMDDAREQIATLDRALQTAYDRGASDQEVAPMWAMRHALVATAPDLADDAQRRRGKDI